MQKSGFFNAILDQEGSPDRSYLAEDFARYFSSFIGNGVFPNPSTNLQVMAIDDDMTVRVKSGKAWINGYYYENTDDYILKIDPADGVLSRIDRIVLRLDFQDREIRAYVKQGNYASNAIAKELQRDADAYEIALADIKVNAGAIKITQANITDLRLNNELCGIVHGTVDQVDTTTIFNQYQAWFNNITDGTEQQIADWQQQQYDDFMIWFQSIQDILDGDVAANLASRISNLENDFTSHLADLTSQEVGKGADMIGLPDPNNLFTATNVGGAMQELFTNVSNGKSLVGGAITDVDENVVIPTDPTFQDLADAIGQISTGKKWASGTTTIITGWNIVVADLPFTPRVVLLRSTRNQNHILYGNKNYDSTNIYEITLPSSFSPRGCIYSSNGFTVTGLGSGDVGDIYEWEVFE